MSATDWIEALRAACAAESQRRVAGRIGYSASVVSQVLAGVYPGDLAAVEQAVRGALMNGVVACPELGSIEGHLCVGWRRAARRFAATNSMRVRMYRACRACPRFTGEDRA